MYVLNKCEANIFIFSDISINIVTIKVLSVGNTGKKSYLI